MIHSKKILIFGGSGSLGHKIIERWLPSNDIINFSRDECKHWKMGLKFKSNKLDFIIGDIRDYNRVENAIIRTNPHLIIIAAALKHVDRCEMAVTECVATNYVGVQNVVNAIEKNVDRLHNLESVCFISTDKACAPINTYGKSKALAESSMISAAYHLKNIKFCTVRYFNVLDSNGSLLPLLKVWKDDPMKPEFTLTDIRMGRAFLTLDSAVDLIEHAVIYSESGDITLPYIESISIKDLFELYSEKYHKPIKITQIRPGEKINESLVSYEESLRLQKGEEYMYLKPFFKNYISDEEPMQYDTTMNRMTKEELKSYLIDLQFL